MCEQSSTVGHHQSNMELPSNQRVHDGYVTITSHSLLIFEYTVSTSTQHRKFSVQKWQLGLIRPFEIDVKKLSKVTSLANCRTVVNRLRKHFGCSVFIKVFLKLFSKHFSVKTCLLRFKSSMLAKFPRLRIAVIRHCVQGAVDIIR